MRLTSVTLYSLNLIWEKKKCFYFTIPTTDSLNIKQTKSCIMPHSQLSKPYSPWASFYAVRGSLSLHSVFPSAKLAPLKGTLSLQVQQLLCTWGSQTLAPRHISPQLLNQALHIFPGSSAPAQTPPHRCWLSSWIPDPKSVRGSLSLLAWDTGPLLYHGKNWENHLINPWQFSSLHRMLCKASPPFLAIGQCPNGWTQCTRSWSVKPNPSFKLTNLSL